ncbi:MAG: 50S ribosomal protein L9 [Elusimicrobia bacterium]|nr:50S ribosomal protein L9 [Elusimicrobiota bacterium]
MKVILRKDISKIGKIGEVKNVADGFGRNYLLPRGMAELATKGAVKNWQLGAERRSQRLAKEGDTAKAMAEKISGLVLSYTRSVGENNQLFGSVSKADIIKSLKASGFETGADVVELPSAVKAVGDTEVTLNLKPGITAKITVRVAPKAA